MQYTNISIRSISGELRTAVILENIVLGAVLQAHDEFIYDDIQFPLVMAFTNKALFGYAILADLR